MNFSLRTIALAFAAFSIQLLVAGPLLAYPTARSNARMVFDESLDRIVLFGGVSDPDAADIRYELNDTWEWTGLGWIQIFPATAPPARSGHSMVYDSNRRQVILFGGIQGGNFLGDTWRYQNRNWIQIAAPSSPSARTLAGMAFDPIRDRVVLHGGVDAGGTRRDTWEFDGTTWTKRLTGGPELQAVNLVYDEARGEILMLGYGSENTSEMYRLASSGWEQLSPEDIPPCVNFSALAYQKHNQTVVFVGGQCFNGTQADDTWEWDGTNWTDVSPTFNPGALLGHALAYDRTRNETVLFGGIFIGATNTTYRYRNGKWTIVSQDREPGPRSLPLMVYDPVRNVTVLYGGVNESREFYDFWQLEGGRWTRIDVEGTPSACSYPVGAWDANRQKLVMVCSDARVHEWDGEVWKSFTAFESNRQPRSDRRFSSAVYDPQSRRVLIFGGYTFGRDYVNEFWSWDGTSWTQLARNRTAPANRSLASFFHDPISGKLILFGGIGRSRETNPVTRYGDMWSWDGSNWTEMTNVSLKPPARYGAQTSTDVMSGRTMLFGGKNDRELYLDDQWEWNGTTWTQVNEPNRPEARMNGGFVFDLDRQRFILFGGFAGRYFSEVRSYGPNGWNVESLPPGRRRGAARPTVITGSGPGSFSAVHQ